MQVFEALPHFFIIDGGDVVLDSQDLTTVRNPSPSSIREAIVASVLSMGSKSVHPRIWKVKYFVPCFEPWSVGSNLSVSDMEWSPWFEMFKPKLNRPPLDQIHRCRRNTGDQESHSARFKPSIHKTFGITPESRRHCTPNNREWAVQRGLRAKPGHFRFPRCARCCSLPSLCFLVRLPSAATVIAQTKPESLISIRIGH